MLITIIAIGRVKAGPERELIARFRKRFVVTGKGLGFSGLTIVEQAEGRSSLVTERRDEEAAHLLAAYPADSYIIALDEHGGNCTSKAFAEKLATLRRNNQRNLVLLIGGADGHGEAIKDAANEMLSFGTMTWPHQIARLMLVEQLYRATTILSGHPYHRE